MEVLRKSTDRFRLTARPPRKEPRRLSYLYRVLDFRSLLKGEYHSLVTVSGIEYPLKPFGIFADGLETDQNADGGG